ncbi:MAG TPA: EAL domain-containing protein [Candidatus Baltobacteraceae bacterium]|nr:EAL domain-containing protein [Candidatus Baltobacteraceae bacterium]
MIRVALHGSLTHLRETGLASRFHICESHESDPAEIDVLVVLPESPLFERETWRGVPAILVVESISTEAVARAAGIGAIDIVLDGDEARLVAAIEAAAKAHVEPRVSATTELGLLRKVFDLTPSYVSIRDAAGRFVLVSQSVADLYATTVEELIGAPLENVASPADAQLDREEDAQVLATGRSRVVEREVVDRTGAKRRLHIIKRPLKIDAATPGLVMHVAIDVTRRYRTEAALENTNDFLKNVLETITEAVFALDLSGKFTLVNRRLIELTGQPQQALLATAFTRIFADVSMLEAKRQVSEMLNGADQRRFEARIAHSDGIERIVAVSLLPLMRQGTFVGIVGTAENVTERRMAEKRIEHLAYHDPLTNLPNRRLLGDRLQMALSQAMRDERTVALLFLDLDRFKAINDTLGHRVGDMLLQELGTRLRACVRTGDTVARMGGDEFVFLIPGLPNSEEAAGIAEKILEEVRVPFMVDGRDLVVTACIGLSFFPQYALDGDALIRQADVALFECKHRGRDSWCAYDSSMSFRSYERFELEHDLRRALRDREFQLYYQPIVDMRSGEIAALEALLRWEHPVRGLLLPAVFIEGAEENGMIVRMGEWALGEAVRQNAVWQEQGLTPVVMSVNVSARQFDGPFVDTVRSTLRSARLDPRYLALELTESTLIQNVASPSRAILELKAIGVELAIDDFGTGYSSLSYLERFPIDTIKIDRSFMPRDMLAPQAGFIAGAVISLAQGMGLRVIAEGIETEEQASFLLARGCVLGQGHLYAPAMPAPEIERLLRGDLGHRVLA